MHARKRGNKRTAERVNHSCPRLGVCTLLGFPFMHAAHPQPILRPPILHGSFLPTASGVQHWTAGSLHFILKVKSSLPWPFTVRCHLLLQAPSPPPGPLQPWTSVSLQSNLAVPGSCLCTLWTPEPRSRLLPWLPASLHLMLLMIHLPLLPPGSCHRETVAVPKFLTSLSLLHMLFPLQSWKLCLSSRVRKQRNKLF